MEGFAIVNKQKPKLNAMNIYNDSQRGDVVLSDGECSVDILVTVVIKKAKSNFNKRIKYK